MAIRLLEAVAGLGLLYAFIWAWLGLRARRGLRSMGNVYVRRR